MIVLKIENVREFMSLLFGSEMFDRFHVRECGLDTFVSFRIRGKLHRDWLDTDETLEDATGLVLWQQLKTVVFSLIKGKRSPGRMRLDFCHYMENGDVGSIRLQYEREELLLFTGYMAKEFSLDRGNGQDWDENCIRFLKKYQVVSTQIQ